MKPICELLQKDETGNAGKETWSRLTGLPAEAASTRMNYFLACFARDSGDHAKEKEHLKAAVDAYGKDADVLIAMYRLPNADDEWKTMTKEKIEASSPSLRPRSGRGPNDLRIGRHRAEPLRNAATVGRRLPHRRASHKRSACTPANISSSSTIGWRNTESRPTGCRSTSFCGRMRSPS